MNSHGRSCLLLYTFGFLILYLGFISTTEYDADDLGARRNAKEFSLFSVVTFKNEECTSDSTFVGGAVKGTCYSTTECDDKSGTKSGNCAAGFGVCCVFVSNIGTYTITQNRTYVQNTLYPAIETLTTAVTYTVNKVQNDVCQLRLDFDNFAIAGPTCTDELAGEISATGSLNGGTNCADKLIITSTSNQIIPTLCGTFTGSHLYVDIGLDATDTATLALTFAGTTPTAAAAFRSWRIQASQIPCWADYRAPFGCHQYHTGSAYGMIWSPNFRTHPSTTSQGNNANPNYKVDLMGQDLKYCIRREKGMCCTLYQVCNEDPDGVALVQGIGGDNAIIDGGKAVVDPGFSFQIDCTAATDCSVTNDKCNVGKVDEACSVDYVEITDSTTGVKNYGAATQVNSRYCCNRFGNAPPVTIDGRGSNNAPVYDCTEPFEVLYHTDMYTDEMKTVTEAADGITLVPRGLCLIYKQEAC